MEEDYEGAKQMVLRRDIAIHPLVSSYPTFVSRHKKERYKKHHKNVSKENWEMRRMKKYHRSTTPPSSSSFRCEGEWGPICKLFGVLRTVYSDAFRVHTLMNF